MRVSLPYAPPSWGQVLTDCYHLDPLNPLSTEDDVMLQALAQPPITAYSQIAELLGATSPTLLNRVCR